MTGPGSITTTWSVPTRYVLVPGPVMIDGFGAVTRITPAPTSTGSPGTTAGPTLASGTGRGDGRTPTSDPLSGRIHVVGVPRHNDLHATALVGHQLWLDGRHGPRTRRRCHQVGRRREPGQHAEVPDRRQYQLDLAGFVPGQGIAWGDPHMLDRLEVVMGGGLPGRRQRGEEPGVVAPRCSVGRDPVTHVVDRIGRQGETLGPADLEKRALAGVEGAPVGDKASLDRRVGKVQNIAILPDRHQDAGLLEALPKGRHPVGEAAGGELEDLAGLSGGAGGG